MTKKRIIVISVIAVVVALIGLKIFIPKQVKVTYDTAKVERGSVAQTVEATGAVVSSGDVELKFEVPGRIRSISAKVGDTVKTGAILASLDNGDAASSVQRAQASVLVAQASLDKLSTGATQDDIKVSEANVASMQADLDASRQALTDTTASSEAAIDKAYADLSGALETAFLKSSGAIQEMSNDIYDAGGNLRADVTPTDANLAQQSNAAFRVAKAALAQMTIDIGSVRATNDRAKLDQLSAAVMASADAIRTSAQLANAMMQSAIPSGSTTQASVDAKKASIKLSWTDLVSADNNANSQRELVASTVATNHAAENAAQARVNAAGTALASAQASLNLKKAPASSFDIESARAQLASAQASLLAAQVAFQKTRIVAPFDGTIAQVTGKVGLTVSGADVIMRIHGDDVYEIEADVPETDVSKLSAGQDATVTLDAYGQDKVFPAKLTTIDNAETVIQDVVYYKTRLVLVSPDQPVRAGMTANVKVAAAKKDNILVIPLRAVHTRDDGSKFVRILKGGQAQEVSVTLGLRGDENRVEVVSGLAEGDEVIMTIYHDGKAV